MVLVAVVAEGLTIYFTINNDPPSGKGGSGVVIIRYKIDSDGDGNSNADEIARGRTSPNDASSRPVPDFSDAVDAINSSASGVDSVEQDLMLWLDAANINNQYNDGLKNGDAITEWVDLSGAGNMPLQLTASLAPSLVNDRVVFDGTDVMMMSANLNLGSSYDMLMVMDGADANLCENHFEYQ